MNVIVLGEVSDLAGCVELVRLLALIVYRISAVISSCELVVLSLNDSIAELRCPLKNGNTL